MTIETDTREDQRVEPWVLASDQPAAGHLYLANGYMSAALDWSGGVLMDSNSVPCYVRGIYNDSGPGGVDRLAAIPCWVRLRYGQVTSLRRYQRELNVRHGLSTTVLELQEARGRVTVEQTVLVSRADPHLAAVTLTITPSFDGQITVLSDLHVQPAGDLSPVAAGCDGDTMWLHCRTEKYGIEVWESASFLAPGWRSRDITVPHGVDREYCIDARADQPVSIAQIVRIATSVDAKEPRKLVFGPINDVETIQSDHQRAWESLWQTDIVVEGDRDVQRFARAALFYLWSSVREADHWSIAPMGLSSNGYNGHIFWDAELWMYPTLLLTQPAMAHACLAYRERTIGAARQRAAADGRRGARYPWEAAFTGDEMTPAFAATGEYQLHITADVAIAQWWYFLNTRDVDWLREHGFPVILECAEYWASRVEHDAARDVYSISNVVCADEYAEHVDNDAFTNAAVRAALLIADRAAQILGETPRPAWRTIAGKLVIPYDEERRIHLEFDGYDGRVTKQADVELLAFPLEHATDTDQIARDLDFYSTVIDPNGPAMSYSIYSIVSAQLGRLADAYEYLLRSFAPNTRPPFEAFSETPTNNEFLFCTGIGGALQTFLYGFTGIRLREDVLVLCPSLPARWSALRLFGLYILGARTDIEVEHGRVMLGRDTTRGRLTLEMVRREQLEIEIALDDTGASELAVAIEDGSGRKLSEIRATDGHSAALIVATTGPMRVRVAGGDGEELLTLVIPRPAPALSEPVA